MITSDPRYNFPEAACPPAPCETDVSGYLESIDHNPPNLECLKEWRLFPTSIRCVYC